MDTLPTGNILQRTFNIRYEGYTGTMFEADHGDHTILVTALHVVAGMVATGTVEIATKAGWDPLPVTLVGAVGDVCVLRSERRLSLPKLPLVLSSDGLVLGQTVHFLGFPPGLPPGHCWEHGGFPVPFVKRASVAAFGHHDGKANFYLDGINNPGFSGGPVFFRHPDGSSRVAGVVNGYMSRPEAIAGAEDLEYEVNTGIIFATEIPAVVGLLPKLSP